MKRPNEPQDKEAARPNLLSRSEEEARRMIHDYAEALREIIKKFRQRLH